MKKKRIIIGAIVFVVLALIGLGVWQFRGLFQGIRQVQQGEVDVTAAQAVSETVPVRVGDLDESIQALGAVESPTQAKLTFSVTQGKVARVLVEPGDIVKAGDPIAELYTTDLEQSVEDAQQNLQDAEDALKEVEEPLTELDISEKSLAVQSSETALKEAQKALAELKKVDLAKLQADVTAAQQALDLARIANERAKEEDVSEKTGAIREMYEGTAKNCVELSAIPEPSEKQRDLAWRKCNELTDGLDEIARIEWQAQIDLLDKAHSVTQAERALVKAQKALKENQGGPAALELAKAELAVAEAEANRDKAIEDLETAKAGPDRHVLAPKEAAVQRAKSALERAELDLKNATLLAPFDGTITLIEVAEGDRIYSSTEVGQLADLTNLRVKVDVDETEISRIEEGQAVHVTVDGLPGQDLTGSVTAIPVQGTLTNGLLYYKVTVAMDEVPEGLKLGMTAQARIVVKGVQNTLLVPTEAIRQLADGPAVTVVTAETPTKIVERRYVKTGASDGIFTEILEGLREGELIEVQHEVPTNPFMQ